MVHHFLPGDFFMRIRDYFGFRKLEIKKKALEAEIECPRCKVKMAKKSRQDVTIDKCLKCGGIWLDKGEIFHILQKLKEAKASK
jgi:ribosomal protein L37AE/L43A